MEITKTKLAIGAAALTGVVIAATAGTLAVFQDPTNTSSTNSFSTGEINLTIDKPVAVVTYTSSGGMMPGDVVTGAVVVTNAATGGSQSQLRYAITVDNGASPATLVNALNLTVKTLGTNCATFDGTTLYGADDPTNPGSVTPRSLLGAGVVASNTHRLVGSPGQGQYTNTGPPDRSDRVLAAATSETLCFRVALPLSSTETYQNMTVTAAFNFVAEQTVNNTGSETVGSF